MFSQSQGRARASKNCANCRAVKRRCDLQRPSCGQCIRARETCHGYRDDWQLVFRDQTDRTIKRSKEKRTKKVARTQVVHSPPSIYSLSPSMDDVGVNYFLRNFVVGGKPLARGCLNYIPSVYRADGEHPTLVTSMAAVGLVALANSTQQPSLVSHARAKYTEAIHRVNAALASPVESVRDSTLMSVISLGVFEHVYEHQSWERHVRGAAALVVMRGKGQFTSPAAIQMFNQVRADMLVSCLDVIKPFPQDLLELQEEAAKYADTLGASWTSGVLGTRCTNLYTRLMDTSRSIPQSDLLEEATVLERDYRKFFASLAMEEPYTTIREAGGDAELVYNGRFDLYQDSWAIRVWNNARNIYIILCRILCHLLAKTLTTDLPPGTRELMELKMQKTMRAQLRAGDDIVATVPQALEFVSSTSEPGACSGLSFHSSVSGGYMLTWCLYLVGTCAVTVPEKRRWIIRRLQYIGRTTRISMALKLVQDIIQMDQCAG
ncbi:transcriptional regulator family: Fungal Specific TF [Penicillium hispanicum]|uniref:transcriptional regulator family: Fungal Specific TF n=1 Tax=Penicillium hispanicum TaxID=1080232 RepID=UPI0025407E57|nr:transcriptional regulator family: Fungal Specific TF [Penicillium hispanicum]KAJ5569504.1 transcriptional regulator family: Fungal Specific TF [Penicillium hispanicum]